MYFIALEVSMVGDSLQWQKNKLNIITIVIDYANILYFPERRQIIFVISIVKDGTLFVFGSSNDHPFWPIRESDVEFGKCIKNLFCNTVCLIQVIQFV